MDTLNTFQSIFGIPPALLIVLLLWTMAWKGVALWKAAQKKQLYWFIALFIINTIGILDILYIFVFSGIKKKEQQVQ